MTRVTMLAMHKDGLITLTPPKRRQNRPEPVVLGPDTEVPLIPAPTAFEEVCRPICTSSCAAPARATLWNEFVARYHYLG